MNFLFVDQILSYELGKGIVGLKHVSPTDSYLVSDDNGRPMLASCIVGEALGQLCSWYIIKTTNGQYRSVAGIVSEAVLYGNAYLGDTIELYVQVEELDEQAVTWNAQAKVRGKMIFEVKTSIGPCLPMEQFNNRLEVMNQLTMIDRPQVMPEWLEGSAISHSNIQYHDYLTAFDRIILWETGQKVTAQKNISLLAPYFVDHFPLKPVLPITILLESKLRLARAFLIDWLGEEKAKFLIPKKVGNIRMRDFVQPGAVIYTTLQLKEHELNRYVFQFKTEMNQKLVCLAQAEFGLFEG